MNMITTYIEITSDKISRSINKLLDKENRKVLYLLHFCKCFYKFRQFVNKVSARLSIFKYRLLQYLIFESKASLKQVLRLGKTRVIVFS